MKKRKEKKTINVMQKSKQIHPCSSQFIRNSKKNHANDLNPFPMMQYDRILGNH